jgi:hypothetical protein
MKSILKKVFQHPVLSAKPPLLIDVGASGGLPLEWKIIAPYSICIAFDADTRDFSVSESEDKGYKKLYSINRLLAADLANEVDFYLTKSPYCSSSLHPDAKGLKPYAFCGLFDVERSVKMSALDLKSALATTNIEYIDWYKTDSQGTDLRIFEALPIDTIEKIIVAEFEPGIIDAYLGEDKLYQLMGYMDKKPFWVTGMQVKGSHRIDQDDLSTLNALQRRSIGSFLKTAPGWCEISYLNTFDKNMELREYLLAWVFSSIKKEHGFALHLAKIGRIKFNETLFDEMSLSSRKSLSKGYHNLAAKAIKKIVTIVLKW